MRLPLALLAALPAVAFAGKCNWVVRQPGDTCIWALDGDCDVPLLCSRGTDDTDCAAPSPPPTGRRLLFADDVADGIEVLEGLDFNISDPLQLYNKHMSMHRRLEARECPSDKTLGSFDSCGAFQKNSDCQETHSVLGIKVHICCADNKDDCCETDTGAVVGVSLGAVALLALIVLAIVACFFCACCKCCPCNKHNKKSVGP